MTAPGWYSEAPDQTLWPPQGPELDVDPASLFPDVDLNPKPWLKRSGSDISKVAPDVKKRRRNYRLKKLVAPKNPLMILNELKPGLQYTISESLINGQLVFTATVEYEPEKKFSGSGLSKKLAQWNAAENAIKELYSDRVVEAYVGKEAENGEEKMEETCEDSKEGGVPEDETPWCSIASLALFKLINEWTPGAIPPRKVVREVKPEKDVLPSQRPMKKPPQNPTSIDPVMLLHQIYPSSKFEETEVEFLNGEHQFTVTMEIDGTVFSGRGSRKKDAKKECAKQILATRNGIFYNQIIEEGN